MAVTSPGSSPMSVLTGCSRQAGALPVLPRMPPPALLPASGLAKAATVSICTPCTSNFNHGRGWPPATRRSVVWAMPSLVLAAPKKRGWS